MPIPRALLHRSVMPTRPGRLSDPCDGVTGQMTETQEHCRRGWRKSTMAIVVCLNPILVQGAFNSIICMYDWHSAGGDAQTAKMADVKKRTREARKFTSDLN